MLFVTLFLAQPAEATCGRECSVELLNPFTCEAQKTHTLDVGDVYEIGIYQTQSSAFISGECTVTCCVASSEDGSGSCESHTEPLPSAEHWYLYHTDFAQLAERDVDGAYYQPSVRFSDQDEQHLCGPGVLLEGFGDGVHMLTTATNDFDPADDPIPALPDTRVFLHATDCSLDEGLILNDHDQAALGNQNGFLNTDNEGGCQSTSGALLWLLLVGVGFAFGKRNLGGVLKGTKILSQYS